MKKTMYIIFVLIIIAIIIVSLLIFNKPQNIYENVENVNKSNIESVDNKYNVETYVTDEMKNTAQIIDPYIICYVHAFTPEYLKSISDNICIIRVISLDSFKHVENGYDYTHGKLLVNNALFGNLNAGEVVEFARLGGYTQRDKFRNYYKGTYESEYLNIVPEDSITIEEGRTYLAYLKYNELLGKYEIIGIKWGLRELDIPKENEYVSVIDIDFESVGLLDNDTNSYVSLKKYIDENI